MPSTDPVSPITNCYRLILSYTDPVHSFIITHIIAQLSQLDLVSICVLRGELFAGLGSVSLSHESTVNCATEIKILIFSTKMLSIQSTVPTKEPNKTAKTDTSPLMTKLHRIGHSCDCISHLDCIVSNTTHSYLL